MGQLVFASMTTVQVDLQWGQERRFGILIPGFKGLMYKLKCTNMSIFNYSLLDNSFAKLHQCSDSCWSSIELGHTVLVNYFPEAARIRVKWSSFKLKSNNETLSFWPWYIIYVCFGLKISNQFMIKPFWSGHPGTPATGVCLKEGSAEYRFISQ